jgi:hypothetical protein
VFLGALAWLVMPLVVVAAGAALAAAVGQSDAALLVVVPVVLAGVGVAVWLYISFSVAVPSLLAEDLRGRKALRRSFRLVRGRWWPTFGILVLGAILAGIASNVITFALTALTFTELGRETLARLIINALGGTLASVLTTPFQAAFVAVLYFDLRVRKEGFDLLLLADRMGVAPSGDRSPLAPPPPVASGSEPPFWPPPPGWTPSPEEPRER